MNSDLFKERLQLIISREKSRSAFAKKCGVAESLLRNYLGGTSLPGMDKLIAMTEAAGVSIDWLATGEGPMRRDQVERAPEPYSEERIGWDPELMTEIIQKFEKALTDRKAYVSPVEKGKMYAKLYEFYRAKKVKIDADEVQRTIKLVVNQS